MTAAVGGKENKGEPVPQQAGAAGEWSWVWDEECTEEDVLILIFILILIHLYPHQLFPGWIQLLGAAELMRTNPQPRGHPSTLIEAISPGELPPVALEQGD